MAKNLVLGPILALLSQIRAAKFFSKIQFQAQFWPKFGPKKLFRGFYLYQILYIVASYHCMLFQGQLMDQTWENGKKPSFGPHFGPFDPNLVPKNFFSWILPLLDFRNCCKLSLYAISRKTNELNLRKWQKNQFWAQFWHFCPKFGLPKFILKIQFRTQFWAQKFFFVGFASTRYYTLLQAILVCNFKEN